MKIWRCEVCYKPSVSDPVGQAITHDIRALGIHGVDDVRMVQVYLLEGDLPKSDMERICRDLLADPVTQEYRFGFLDDALFKTARPGTGQVVEIAYNPGVMDPWEESTRKAIRDLGITIEISVKTGRQYRMHGTITLEQANRIADKLLYNKVIQHVVTIDTLKKTLQKHKEVTYHFQKITVDILGKDDAGLAHLSRGMCLSLNAQEMRAVQEHFQQMGRNPTDCELETIAQTWSEHCVHKTFKATVDYTDHTSGKPRKKLIRNLLKSTIMDATRKLAKPWCVSVFKDNAGVIKFDSDWNICFKVETHNHPSALEPYGGAGTGVGGVIRDILGVGLGAKPVMNTDVFCFGRPDTKPADVPKGVLHPQRTMKGVVSGVRDYGNRMGIPTANGAIIFDERFTANPLVYCGTVGIMPKKCSFKKVSSGDYVVVVGGRTGRDGIHGATFSSIELSEHSETVSSGAVQIGNAITEKKVQDTLLQARDKRLYSAITDCGAGGLSSAVGEMGQYTGARVDLEKVPLKYHGLSYSEIWISEAQERMVLSVPATKLKALLAIFESENVEATVIGEFTADKRLRLQYRGTEVCDLDMAFLHDGVPLPLRTAVWKPAKAVLPKPRQAPANLNKDILAVLGDLNICSKEWVIRQYDHEVQGTSVLKPLAGVANDSPQNGAVIRPLPGSRRGIVVGCGINSRYGDIDPYWMAMSCVDEALRQVIAVGGNLDRVALLDNFCWGDTTTPQGMGKLVRACLACAAASAGFKVPFISGKDSLNNEFSVGKKKISIPATLLISAIGVIDNVELVVSSDAKRAGNYIYCLGTTYEDMGGSAWSAHKKWRHPQVPRVDIGKSRAIMERLSACIKQGLVASCHDCSDGGLAVTLAEMAFGGGLGMDIDLGRLTHRVPRTRLNDAVLLFSESNSRFVVEVAPEKARLFEAGCKGSVCRRIGIVAATPRLRVTGLNATTVIDQELSALKEAWQAPLRW